MTGWDKAKEYLLFYAKDDSIIKRRDIRNQLNDAVKEGNRLQAKLTVIEKMLSQTDTGKALLKLEKILEIYHNQPSRVIQWTPNKSNYSWGLPGPTESQNMLIKILEILLEESIDSDKLRSEDDIRPLPSNPISPDMPHPFGWKIGEDFIESQVKWKCPDYPDNCSGQDPECKRDDCPWNEFDDMGYP